MLDLDRSVATIEALVYLGADVNVKDNKNITALQCIQGVRWAGNKSHKISAQAIINVLKNCGAEQEAEA